METTAAQPCTAPSLRDLRNGKIRADFTDLHNQGFRNEVIFTRLQAKYFLAQDTIERIVFQRGHYRVNVTVQPARMV